MIYTISGLPKVGKTHEMVRRLSADCAAGSDIATNIALDMEAVYELYPKVPIEKFGKVFMIERLSDTEQFTHGKIYIDEAGAMIHARDWHEMSPLTRVKFTQHMHDSLDVWLAAHTFENIDATIRDLTAYAYVIVPNNLFLFWKGYNLDIYTPAARKINLNQPIEHRFHLYNKKIFACYNYKQYERSGAHSMLPMRQYVE